MPENKEGGKKAVKPTLPFQKRKQLERDLDHITEEMYRRNKELAETNKTLTLLRTIDALALESHISLKVVCDHIANAITQATDYPFVGLFTRSTHSKEAMTLYGWSGKDFIGGQIDLGLSHPIHIKSHGEWLEHPGSAKVISLQDLSPADIAGYLNCSESEIQRMLKKLPLKSIYVVKMVVRRRLVGLLVAGFYSITTQLNESDALLMDRVSESIGVALDNKLLFEENQHVLRQLRASNTKLKALDEAKDDFISMASHQLRTPLTSVKGYLSMVLEGDAGKLTPTEKQLLTQALYSSQRMAYIISDLLNVSRLRTGKFIIERKVVNLAEIVGQEIVQLKESAAQRSIELTYDKPEAFPELMLDETKIRQVIMNFTDNALYYTPPGGHVRVKLIDKPHTVELRVEDDGIGVPKSEQPHLFTKFYRAGNARKARPDGTGLGLYMAKKVVVAQGGSVLFESREGRGSTFGFAFSKEALAVPPNPTPAPDKATSAPAK